MKPILLPILALGCAIASITAAPQPGGAQPGSPTAGVKESAAATGACEAPPPSTLSAIVAASPPSAVTTAGAIPADAVTSDAAIAATENVVGCLNAGRFAEVAALTTPAFPRTAVGVAEPAAAPEALAFPPLALLSLGDVATHGVGRVGVDVVYRREEGQHMLLQERWFFVAAAERLLLDALTPLPVAIDGPRVDVPVRIVDHAYELGRADFAVGEAIVFDIANAGRAPHEFAVFRLPAGATTEGVIAAGGDGAEFVGGLVPGPGETGELALVALDPGAYTVASFVAAPDGTPQAARGMVAGFTVR